MSIRSRRNLLADSERPAALTDAQAAQEQARAREAVGSLREVAQRVANEFACLVVYDDLQKPQAQRRFFPEIAPPPRDVSRSRSPASPPPPSAPAPALVRALRHLLQPLVRLLLRHQVTFPYLSNLLKGVYVEMGERELTDASGPANAIPSLLPFPPYRPCCWAFFRCWPSWPGLPTDRRSISFLVSPRSACWLGLPLSPPALPVPWGAPAPLLPVSRRSSGSVAARGLPY